MKSDAECPRKKLTVCDRNGIEFAAVWKMWLPTWPLCVKCHCVVAFE